MNYKFMHMRFYLFFVFICLLYSNNIYAQDKTVAKEFNQMDDEFIKKVNNIAKDERVDIKEDILIGNYSIEKGDSDSSRIHVEKRLESEKQNRKFYHELPYWALKGRIKKITITRYLAGYDQKKKVITRTNNGQIPITTNYLRVSFDENGYPTDYIETSIERGISKTITRRSKYIGPQLFEEVENNETGTIVKKYMGLRNGFDVIFKEKNGKKNGEINTFYNEKKQLVYRNDLDDKGNNIVETKNYKNNLPVAVEQKITGILNYKSQTEYNPDNTIKEITQIIVDTKPFTRFYKYTEKDSHNNWIERVCYNNDKIPMWLEKAEYEYEFENEETITETVQVDILSSDSTSIIIQSDIIQLSDSISYNP